MEIGIFPYVPQLRLRTVGKCAEALLGIMIGEFGAASELESTPLDDFVPTSLRLRAVAVREKWPPARRPNARRNEACCKVAPSRLDAPGPLTR